jgi:serine/threonine protein kinase
MSDGSREQRLRDLFDRAVALSPAERDALLATVDDEVLRERLRALLQQDARGTASVLKAPAAAIELLRRVGDYELLRELGRGGMGIVWLARQVEPVERLVALKMVRADDGSAIVERFEQERQTLALMNHPGIARLFDGGATADGTLFFAMEYVRGEPITVYCNRRRFAFDDRLALFATVCDAVQHAHQKAVLHRDLKPGNVLVSDDDGNARCKVIDFGIARALARAPGQALLPVEAGGVLGTWQYMSPEQADPSGQDIDTRSDIYALGVMLYELLTGELPLTVADPHTEDALERFRGALQRDVPMPASTCIEALPPALQALRAEQRGSRATVLQRQLRGDLDFVLARALAKDRNDRYATASELRADLDRHRRCQPVTAVPPSWRYLFGRFVRRNRALVAAASLAVVGLVAGLVGAVRGMSAAQRAQASETAAHRVETRARVRAVARAGFADLVLLYGDPGTGERAPSLRDVLDRLATTIGRRYGDQPLEEIAVLASVGRAYLSAGEAAKAEPLLRRAWDLAAPSQDEEPLPTFLLLSDLARATRKVRGLDAGRGYGAALLELGMRGLRARAPDLAQTLAALAEMARRPEARADFARRLDDVIARVSGLPPTDEVALYASRMLGTLMLLLDDRDLAAGQLMLARLEAAARSMLEKADLVLLLVRFAERQLRPGQYAEARRLAGDVLSMLDDLGFGNHWLRLQAERQRGLALALDGEAAAGETALLALRARLWSLGADANEQAQAAARCLRELCERLADAGRLEPFCRDSLERWRAALARGDDAAWWPAWEEGLPAAALAAANGALAALPEAARTAPIGGAQVRAALGGVLLRQERTAAALVELEAARAGAAPAWPELLADLARACHASGRGGDAAAAFAELEAAAARAVPAARGERALARARADLGR